MSKELKKNVQALVTKETWVELRVIGLRRGMTLPDICAEILEKAVQNKIDKNKITS